MAKSKKYGRSKGAAGLQYLLSLINMVTWTKPLSPL